MDERLRHLALLVCMLAILVTVVAAVPIVWWLLQRGPLSLKRLLMAGFVLGNIPLGAYLTIVAQAAIYHLVNGTISQHLLPLLDLLTGLLHFISVGSFVGSASALVFWLVAVSTWGSHEQIRIFGDVDT